MNRGSTATDGRSRAAPTGFNEAPIHESGKSCACVIGWLVCSASMRPRFMNRGSNIYPDAASASAAASMRPRFMNRGSEKIDHFAGVRIGTLQ